MRSCTVKPLSTIAQAEKPLSNHAQGCTSEIQKCTSSWHFQKAIVDRLLKIVQLGSQAGSGVDQFGPKHSHLIPVGT